ncbi:glycosyl transferase family protein [Alcanivorax profundi]|uniref:Glycosyl transferase family protein n=1 Tax=Alcanivorax profundi TaxID=2338368 RepID=A0A418Y371_9GAMM|nr:glycosyl transferase family protein [Alcanivorax profundi]RJG19953.1 glycosyl transferase family protein [Alcanivorax profundi]
MTEHAFAEYVRTLGRGKRARRSLTREEARNAMQMILDGEVEDVQLGAFLMLLRVKEETPDELAGFLDACRGLCDETLQDFPAVQLDWPSYAGKKKHHPWYLLATVLLADQGIRTLLHGGPAHTPNRVYTDELLPALGLKVATTVGEASDHLARQGLAYLPIEQFCAPLSYLLTLRFYLGLRSPINTLARSLNPARAPLSMQSVFHPAYIALHQGAAELCGDRDLLLFKGEGGELEIRPDARTAITGIRHGKPLDDAILDNVLPRTTPPGTPDADMLKKVWRGEAQDEYGENAVIQTVAVALWGLDKAENLEEAQQQARALWQNRDTRRAMKS